MTYTLTLENIQIKHKDTGILILWCLDGAPFEFIKQERSFIKKECPEYNDDYLSSVHLKDGVELHLSIKGNTEHMETCTAGQNTNVQSITISAIGFNMSTRKIMYRVRDVSFSLNNISSSDEALPTEQELETMISDKRLQIKKVVNAIINNASKNTVSKLQLLESLESIEENLKNIMI